MSAYDAASVNLSHLNPQNVSYEPKGIHTEAIHVTSENIGMLSLEFETELLYSNSQSLPYFYVTLARKLDQDTSETGMTGTSRMCVRVNDWIVPLRNEIHIYTDELFVNTFTFDAGGYVI
jgi:hypothetical protein